jgi:hypothetical protein
MDELARTDGRVPTEEFEVVLIHAMSNPYGNWEGSRAASMAAQLLSYISSCLDDGLDWPSDAPDAIAGPDYWPGPSEFSDLDQGDTEGLRDEWRARLQGPPPWKPGQDLVGAE